MNTPFDDIGLSLLQAIFDLYIFIVMLRIVLQWGHADFRNPLFAFVAKLTNPPVLLIRRVIPQIHGIDLAGGILLLAMEVVKLILLVWLQINSIPPFSGLVILAFAELLSQLLNIFFYAILGIAVLSWVSPLAHGPLVEVLFRLTEPFLRPIRRFIPLVKGLDFTPVIVLVVLKLITSVIVQPLIQIGAVLTFGSGVVS